MSAAASLLGDASTFLEILVNLFLQKGHFDSMAAQRQIQGWQNLCERRLDGSLAISESDIPNTYKCVHESISPISFEISSWQMPQTNSSPIVIDGATNLDPITTSVQPDTTKIGIIGAPCRILNLKCRRNL